MRWALAGGLGALLYRGFRDDMKELPPSWHDALLSAELTARVRHGELEQTALEVIDTCSRLGVRVTLLKGISISEQYWPQAHLRPMSDIDVLIPAAAYASVEAALLESGYERLDYPALEGQHHGAPLHHARRDTLVELHTALFPAASPFAGEELFSLPALVRRSVDAHHAGRPVQRLSPELQLVYIAASWVNDLTLCGIQPGFLASLFDAVYLLTACDGTIDRDWLVEAPVSPMARAALYTMATYLPRFGVRAVAAPRRLASRQDLVGPLQLRLMHWVLDRHLIGARPWRLPFPIPVAGRYHLRRQLDKRILRRLPA